MNANQGVEIPELVSVTAGDGTVSAIHPYTGDGDGEGIDFDYCWVAGYAEAGLGGEIVSCPADPRPGVTLLQQDLNRLGYGPVVVDGDLGAQTLAAAGSCACAGRVDRDRSSRWFDDLRAEDSTSRIAGVWIACRTPATTPLLLRRCMRWSRSVPLSARAESVLAAYTVDEAFDNPAGGPDLSPAVALFRSLDGSLVLINWWERVDEGQAVSRYSQDALVGEGVPVAVAARLMADLSASA